MHDVEYLPSAPRPIIGFGLASSLLAAEDELLNINLKPLADNWRILALVEIEADVDAGIAQRSVEKQTGPGIVSIESLIYRARYAKTLNSGAIEQAIRDGIAATSAMMVCQSTMTRSGPMERLDPAALASMSVETLLADSNWREAILRIPVDVLLWNKFKREPQAGLLDQLDRACREAFGDNKFADSLLKAASGRYAVGPSAPISLTTAAAIALSDEAVANNPHTRFRHDMLMIGHLAQSLARRVLEPIVVPKIAAGWAGVLKDQRFALQAPAINCPDMETAVTSIETSGLKGAAQLILAAAPAVGYEFKAGWEELLVKIGGVTSD